MDDPPLGRRRGNRVDGPEQQRVVRDQQISCGSDRLVDHRLHRVDGQQHSSYLSGLVADDEADRVTRFRPPRGNRSSIASTTSVSVAVVTSSPYRPG